MLYGEEKVLKNAMPNGKFSVVSSIELQLL